MSRDLPESPYERHFDALGASYDRLRSDPSDEYVEMLIREGDLRGRRVLDVGCGTGRLAAALAERHGATVSGVEPSLAMLEVARGRAPEGVVLERGTAEELPFHDRSFERVVMRMVVHLVERAQTFAEVGRVLAPGGRVVILTLDPAGIGGIWLKGLFPSYEKIERRRFPEPETLADELRAAGFPEVRTKRLEEGIVYDRERALAMLQGRFASSFALIGDDEYRAGLERAERELPGRVEFVLKQAVLVARR